MRRISVLINKIAMKRLVLIMISALICGAVLNSCDAETAAQPANNSNDPDKTILKGTNWKLVGIVNGETEILTELEPKDCEQCYTFEFDKFREYGLSGKEVCNFFEATYDIDYTTNSIHILEYMHSQAGCLIDERPYFKYLDRVFCFSVQEDKLKLYFDENNFLFYKILE